MMNAFAWTRRKSLPAAAHGTQEFMNRAAPEPRRHRGKKRDGNQLVTQQGRRRKLDRASNIRLLLLLATIGGLGYAFFRAQSVDFDELARIRSRLESLRQLEQTVDRDTLKIRVGLPSSDDALMRLTDRMTGLLAALQKNIRDSLDDAPEGLAASLHDYGALLEKRKKLLQRFRMRNATVRDSLRSFPAIAAELSAAASGQSGGLQRALDAFEIAVLRYHIEASSARVANISQSVGRLQRIAADSPPSIAGKIASLLRDGEVIVTHRTEADWTLKELLTVSGLRLLDNVLESYRRKESTLHGENSAYRSVMFVTALILVGYIVMTLVSLLQVRRDLQRANRELETRIADISRAKEEAELANRSKSEFLAMMSHELRTPLNAVIGFSDLMRMEAFGPVGSARYREYAGDIHDSARHLLSLINDILDLSKIERGSLKPDDEELNVPAAIRAVETLVKDRAERGRVALTLDCPETLPPLRADPRQFKQMLANLWSNAIKFTDPGGRVSVKVACDPARGFVFAVEDSGVGMTKDDIPKALAPFVQVDRSLSRKHEGTGLGLPLTKRMIELHGGKLELESAPGVGTKATLIFPLSRIVRPAKDSEPDKDAAQGAVKSAAKGGGPAAGPAAMRGLGTPAGEPGRV
jgi:signal transduction histidine kinase